MSLTGAGLGPVTPEPRLIDSKFLFLFSSGPQCRHPGGRCGPSPRLSPHFSFSVLAFR